jgi:uncharacterized protein YegP (UPF0339 family)
MQYIMYKDTAGQWRWTFYSSNGKAIAVSSEGYHNKADCQNSITLVKGSAAAPIYER